MFRTKQGVGRAWTAAARALALGLCVLMLGCADSGGLRSVWPDRPSLLGLREKKPQDTPDPANDYYARYMRSARERTSVAAKAKRSGGGASPPARGDEATGPPGPDDTMLADQAGESAAAPASPREPAAPDEPARDETIRVTLGRPEPLPRASDAVLASARSVADPAEPEPAPRRPAIDRSPPPMRRAEAPPEEPPASLAAVPVLRPAPSRPAATSKPTPKPKAAKPAAQDGRAILAQSEARLKALDTYQVKMSRVERVGGQLQPEEEVVLSIHREPREVRLAWESGPSAGREVIYSTRVDPKTLFVHMPKTAIPLPTMKMAIDSPMVTRSSRHSIREAGFDTIIGSLRKSIDQDAAEDAAQGRVAYRGIETPPGLDRPSHVFTRRAPAGESWTVFIDARSLLPSMVVAKNKAGELDEKYVYHGVSENPTSLAAADAFDPDQRWGSAKGLLGRFAGGRSATPSPGNGQSTVR